MIINYVVSIGSFCITSMQIKTLGLKKFSCPFDWILSNIKMVQDCISNDFSTFLDKEEYISKGCNYTAHKTYSNVCVFPHHDPLNNKDHYEYFSRCASRFLTLLKSKKGKLFIYSLIFTSNSVKDLIKDFIDLCSIIKQKTTNYQFLLIIITGITDNTNYEKIYDDDDIYVYKFNRKSETNGIKFMDKEDDICYCKILKNFEYELLDEIIV